MSTEKLSELSKPVAWILGTPACKHLTTDEEYANWYVEKMSTALPLYSQEYVSALTQRIEELEAKLATPVRLPTQENYDDPLSAHLAINDSAEAIRAAGFKVMGDEQC